MDDYMKISFMEVRSLVLQYEMEPDLESKLDDPLLFRASNQVIRAKIVICGLRERATKVHQIISVAPQLGQIPLRKFEDERSIWFDDSFHAELLCLIPIAVARCPELLSPELEQFIEKVFLTCRDFSACRAYNEKSRFILGSLFCFYSHVEETVHRTAC